MSRVGDVVLGAGIVVCLAGLVACFVQAVVEVLEVERVRRERCRRAPLMSGGVELGARPDAVDAPPSGLSPVLEDEIARTVRRVHADICDGWEQ